MTDKTEDGHHDEIEALKEAMKFAYGDKYYVDEKSEEKDDPFAEAARITAEAEPEKKSDAVDKAVERAVEHEKYVPVNLAPQPKERKHKGKSEPQRSQDKQEPERPAPGEDIDPSDIAAVRAMLTGGL